MVSRRKRANSSVANKLSSLTDRVTGEEKLQQVSGTQTNAVTNDSIALGAVNTESVSDRSITGNKIGRGEVTSDNLGVINEIVASGGLDIETGVSGHLSLSGGKYEEPYDGIENGDGYMTVAFDPTDNAIKIIDNAVTAGSFGSATEVGTFTVDAQGRLTLAGSTTISPPLTNLSDVDITSVTTGQTLLYNGTNFVNTAPPSYNYIINGAFDIWQRGTSGFTTSGVYQADRWVARWEAGTATVGQSTDVPSNQGLGYSISVASTSGTNPKIYQRIEAAQSRRFADKTITISVWAKSTTGTAGLAWNANYPGADDNWSSETADQSGTFTASMTVGTWTRYTATFTANALATRGYGIVIYRNVTTTSTTTLYTGIQIEEGSIATPFRRNAPSIQAELAACQRYYQRIVAKQAYSLFASGVYNTTTACYMPIFLPVELRTTPAVSYSGAFRTLTGGTETVSNIAIYTYSSTNPVSLAITTSSTTDGNAAVLTANNDVAAYLEFYAEL